MPILPPVLDDRRFEDLVSEMLSRIPGHTPEWTSPQAGDPGRTLIELFAWLADTLLYRANLIPERQRLAFLRLLGIPMRPALPARCIVSVSIDDTNSAAAKTIAPLARLKAGSLIFESNAELTVLPVAGEIFYKRKAKADEVVGMDDILIGLKQIYQIDRTKEAVPYVTTPLFVDGAPATDGFDVIGKTVDKALWVALLAQKPELVEEARTALGVSETGSRQTITVGIIPSVTVPSLFENIGNRAKIPHTWEITGVDSSGRIEFHQLDCIADTTNGLTVNGVQRLTLPTSSAIGAPSNDVRLPESVNAGVGTLPPRIDDPKKSAASRCVVAV
jgi:predicted phage baseplate assembly protein